MKKHNDNNLEDSVFRTDKDEVLKDIKKGKGTKKSAKKSKVQTNSVKEEQLLKFVSAGILLIMLAISAVFVYMAWSSGFLPNRYLLILVAVVLGVNILAAFLLFGRGSWKKRLSAFALIIVSAAVFIYISVALGNVNRTIGEINEEIDDVHQYSVVVLAEDTINSYADLADQQIAFVDIEAEAIMNALTDEEFSIGNQIIAYPQLVGALMSGEERVILFNETFRPIIEEIYINFSSGTKILGEDGSHRFEGGMIVDGDETEVSSGTTNTTTTDETSETTDTSETDTDSSSEVDQTEETTQSTSTSYETLPSEEVREPELGRPQGYEDIYVDGSQPFTFYISGMDNYGGVGAAGRSDVNIVGAVNPHTRTISLINIPRDSYVPLPATGGYYDKLTHAGLLGINSSLSAVENLIGRDVSTYLKVNFNSLINIVDTIGGITVYNPTPFSSGGYNFPAGNIQMDGRMALQYSRERYSLAGGDIARGQNQMRVIQGIFNKAMQPSILLNYNSLLNSVSGSIRTNLSQQAIGRLVNNQLASGGGWTFNNYTMSGYSQYGLPSYFLPGYRLYFLRLSNSSISQAQAIVANTIGY